MRADLHFQSLFWLLLENLLIWLGQVWRRGGFCKSQPNDDSDWGCFEGKATEPTDR